MTAGFEWRHAPEACAKDFGDLKKVSELNFSLRGRRLISGLAEALRRVRGQMEKLSLKDCAYLSPFVKKPFNSKVIKSFIPKLRNRKCFSCFGILKLSMCVMDIMHVLRTGMNMSISRIHILLCNSLPGYLVIYGETIVWCVRFRSVLTLCKRQTTLSKIWTRVTVFIYNSHNRWTTKASSDGFREEI